VRLLHAGEVLSGTIAVAALLEATMAVVASGALTEEVKGEAMQEVAVSLETPKAAEALEVPEEEATEEVMGEATGKLKERSPGEGPMRSFFFYSISAGILSFTNLSFRSKLVFLKNSTPP
jgi:hypothetical protein